jgi:hypothetical protein
MTAKAKAKPRKKRASKRASTSNGVRKQCTTKGCRRMRKGSQLYCAPCAAANPMEEVEKLPTVDRLRFVELDTAIRNAAQGVQILKLEQSVANQNHVTEKAARQRNVDQLVADINSKKAEYAALLAELGAKYQFDPNKVIIDDKTGVIRVEKSG